MRGCADNRTAQETGGGGVEGQVGPHTPNAPYVVTAAVYAHSADNIALTILSGYFLLC